MVLKPEHLKRLMRPIVRAFLRHTYSIHDFMALAKSVFVEVAEEEILSSGGKPNVSRLSAMTGVYRKEVSQIFTKNAPPLYQGASLIARVLSAWESNKKFSSSPGKPRCLTYGTSDSEFSALVSSVSTDIHEGTVLNELKRARMVEITEQGACMSKREAYVPGDVDRAVSIIAGNMENCLRSGEQNALSNPQPRNLHLRTAYDNLYLDKLPEIRAWVLEQGRDFHRRIREFVAPFDCDLGIDQEPERPSRGHLVVSSFSYSATPPEQSSSEQTLPAE